ncbi:hypothetical protein [Amycolatopsis sp.]|uniref:hypothetical protein n=1 Tax=Amycolatopsis sp. TaxID=37632 RepID=UPI002B7D86FC|nr:hypothetical protein [Amycolatopsis sp.]HVV11736.1 hypothetical protein [Amycolatopsis sp.]
MTSVRWRRWFAIAAIGATLTACENPARTATAVITTPDTTSAPSSPARSDDPLQQARPSTLEVPAIGVRSGRVVELGLTTTPPARAIA